MFKRFLPKSVPNMTKPSLTEYKYFESTYNGALQKLKQAGECNCIGYDFSNSYGNMMSSNLFLYGERIKFHLATSEGQTNTNIKLPKIFQYGIYKAKITSRSKYFDMLFCINEENYYTHYELNFLLKHKKELKVDIELLGDNIVYSDDILIDGFKIFNQWNKILGEIKKELPSNGLIKLLRSRLWGTLSQSNTLTYSDSELDENGIEFNMDPNYPCDYLLVDELHKNNGETLYKILNKNDPYKHEYRLKSFLTAFQRVQTAEIAIRHKNAVHRIHTDNITYDVKRLKKYYIEGGDVLHSANDLPTFIKESKTTGLFNFVNVNNYERLI